MPAMPALAALPAPGDGLAGGHCCVLEAPEPEGSTGNNFSKGLKWSPDGLTLIASHDDATLRLFSIEDGVLAGAAGDAKVGGGGGPQALAPYATATEGGPVLDFCFFPSFSWEQPATCGFITSSQDHPIHLRDALTGRLCNTYRPYNTVDEVCHAYSLCFSPDGARIVGGFSQYLRVFDVQRPGRQVEDWLLSTRKGKGQKGIIGAVAAAETNPGMYAAGSYNKTVCVYHQGNRGKPVAWLADGEYDYEMGGVTQLEWVNEWLLLSGHRRDNWLRAWDLRMASSGPATNGGAAAREANGMRPKALLHRFARVTRTHQRFMFSAQRGQLATGDDAGDVLLYSLERLEQTGRIAGAHQRPCVAAMLHPTRDVVASASGGRLFPDYDVDSSAGSASPSPSPARAGPPPGKRRRRAGGAGGGPPAGLDNSVRVWQLGAAAAAAQATDGGGEPN